MGGRGGWWAGRGLRPGRVVEWVGDGVGRVCRLGVLVGGHVGGGCGWWDGESMWAGAVGGGLQQGEGVGVALGLICLTLAQPVGW